MGMSWRSAIVTGASSGIGEALARALAKAGVTVGLTARRADRLESIANEIQAQGGIAAWASADAANPSATLEAISNLIETIGPIDLLIANAGRAGRASDLGFSADSFEKVLRVNLLGTAYAIDAVLPGMIERGQGQLVGISSMAGYRGLPGSAGSYSTSKAGLSNMLEGLRIELRGKGIAVSVVHPGFVRTPMTSKFQDSLSWVVSSETAAQIILKGARARKRTISFPWQAACLMGSLRLLPGFAYDRLVQRLMPR